MELGEKDFLIEYNNVKQRRGEKSHFLHVGREMSMLVMPGVNKYNYNVKHKAVSVW